MTRRQLLSLAAAAPAAAVVSAPAVARHFEVGEHIDLGAVLYHQMTPAARHEALQVSLALGIISPDLVRQALDLDLP